MKNIFLFGWFSLLSAPIIAQPTLTSLSLNPVPGDFFIEYPADTTGVMPGNSGSNVTWNFSNLNIWGFSNFIDYVTVNSTGFSAAYPSSTVAENYGGLGNFNFLKCDSSDIRIQGFSASAYWSVYHDDQIIYSFPFTFNSIVNDSFASNYNISGTSVLRTGTSSTNADGYGTLILPGGTFPNVLRVKFVQNFTDDDGFFQKHSNVTTYNWFSEINKAPLLKIVFSNYNGMINKFVKVGSQAVGITEDLSVVSFSINPNPVEDQSWLSIVTLEAGEFELTIVNGIGQVVHRKNFRTRLGENFFGLNLSELTPGFYSVSLLSDSGRVSQRIMKN